MLRLAYWPEYKQQELDRQLQISAIHHRLHRKEDRYTGWVDYQQHISQELVQELIATAGSICRKCSAFVVIGIGGSYLGAKACIELLRSPFANEYGKLGSPKIYFAGHHLSSIYYDELLQYLQGEEVCLCVISKSGTTLEPAVIFQLFKQFMLQKYGAEEMAKRIYAITDEEQGALRAEADREGYKTFNVPGDIGGRYSVLTPVGLLPIAVAGINIEHILAGAREAYQNYSSEELVQNICYQYGLLRYLLQEQGKIIEIFEVYDGKLRYFTEWLKQLFGESECKEGKGVLPMSLQMSTDLHSMGQFLQEGRQNFFETVLTVKHVAQDVALDNQELLGSICSMHELNEIIQGSVQKAHQVNWTPYIQIIMEDISAHTFGELVYFFEKACAVSCYLTGVNPFDQPGVEAYKGNIRQQLQGN